MDANCRHALITYQTHTDTHAHTLPTSFLHSWYTHTQITYFHSLLKTHTHTIHTTYLPHTLTHTPPSSFDQCLPNTQYHPLPSLQKIHTICIKKNTTICDIGVGSILQNFLPNALHIYGKMPQYLNCGKLQDSTHSGIASSVAHMVGE